MRQGFRVIFQFSPEDNVSFVFQIFFYILSRMWIESSPWLVSPCPSLSLVFPDCLVFTFIDFLNWIIQIIPFIYESWVSVLSFSISSFQPGAIEWMGDL